MMKCGMYVRMYQEDGGPDVP